MKNLSIFIICNFVVMFNQTITESKTDDKNNFVIIINESTKPLGIVDPPILNINKDGAFCSRDVYEDTNKSINEYLTSGTTIKQINLQIIDEQNTSVKSLDKALAKLKDLSDPKRKTIIYLYFGSLYKAQNNNKKQTK